MLVLGAEDGVDQEFQIRDIFIKARTAPESTLVNVGSGFRYQMYGAPESFGETDFKIATWTLPC